HYNAHLDTGLITLFDHVANSADDVKIQPTAGVTGQGLATDLQQDALILRFRHKSIPFRISIFLGRVQAESPLLTRRSLSSPFYFNITFPFCIGGQSDFFKFVLLTV